MPQLQREALVAGSAMNTPDQEYRPKWENRRRTIFGILFFCAAVITYLIIWGEDTALNEAIAQFAFILAGSTAGAYIFGATWESVRLKP